ncbi:uncharacterized protein LOC133034095 [Cannabis sativa]|uniref:uncharacterized protein LOC133034095 n=1 Tax=Cannabis sativa TaxID=3483 RepID=UPI0029CA7E7D|nr:uncharacterized protein LOC133034095 [Cannabis sativa]
MFLEYMRVKGKNEFVRVPVNPSLFYRVHIYITSADVIQVATQDELTGSAMLFGLSKHWMLIIAMTSGRVVFLNPLKSKIPSDIAQMIKAAYANISSNAIVFGKNGPEIWTFACPKQPYNYECGSYVLTYIRDMLQHSNPITAIKTKNFPLQSEVHHASILNESDYVDSSLIATVVLYLLFTVYSLFLLKCHGIYLQEWWNKRPTNIIIRKL